MIFHSYVSLLEGKSKCCRNHPIFLGKHDMFSCFFLSWNRPVFMCRTETNSEAVRHTSSTKSRGNQLIMECKALNVFRLPWLWDIMSMIIYQFSINWLWFQQLRCLSGFRHNFLGLLANWGPFYRHSYWGIAWLLRRALGRHGVVKRGHLWNR